VNAAEESRSIRALDKLTGKEVWKAEASSLELCFGTPVLVDGEGGRAELMLAVPGELWGLNPDTGKLRWFAETGIDGNVPPSVVAADSAVYVTGGFPCQGSAAEYGCKGGIILGSSGHLRVGVSASQATVDYVRTDRSAAHSYAIS
jgi:hypothetical protein